MLVRKLKEKKKKPQSCDLGVFETHNYSYNVLPHSSQVHVPDRSGFTSAAVIRMPQRKNMLHHAGLVPVLVYFTPVTLNPQSIKCLIL